MSACVSMGGRLMSEGLKSQDAGSQGDFTGLLQSLNPLGETEKKASKVTLLLCQLWVFLAQTSLQ